MSLYQFITAYDDLYGVSKKKSASLGVMSLLSFARSVKEYCRCQDDYQHVLNLPDYLLEDIGLTRTQVIDARLRNRAELLDLGRCESRTMRQK